MNKILLKSVLAFLLVFCFLFFPFSVSASSVVYPKVSSVSPANVEPGATITLNGTGFAYEGQVDCWGRYDQATNSWPDKHLISYQTVIGAYKRPKEPTSGIPDFRLTILSLTPNTIQAQIPSNAVAGDYYVGYNAEFAKGICEGYGDILVGFGHYDLITIGGSNIQPAVPPTTAPQTKEPTLALIPTSAPDQGEETAFPTPKSEPNRMGKSGESPKGGITKEVTETIKNLALRMAINFLRSFFSWF